MKYYFLSIFILATACISNKKTQNFELPITKSRYTISLFANTKKGIRLDSVFNITSAIKLEASKEKPESLLADVSKVQSYGDDFYILDRKYVGVKVFNNSGAFKFQVGELGSGGPGQYSKLNDFSIENDRILLLTENQQLLEFDLSRNFIKDNRTNLFAWHFSVLNENNFLFFVNYNGDGSEPSYNVFLTDDNFNVLKKIAPFSEKTGRIPIYDYTGFLRKTNGKTLFTEAFGNVIYQIDESAIIPKYDVDFKNYGKPMDVSLNEQFAKHLDFSHIENRVFEIDNYLFFDIVHDGRIQTCMFNSKSEELIQAVNLEMDYLGYLFNLNTPYCAINQKQFLSVIQVERILYLRENEAFMTSMQEKNPALYRTFEKYESSDNPLILIYDIL